jgi:TolB-like protein/Flp pilus assembly protein TadD
VSYARADRPRVRALTGALESDGFEVWWDALIEGGAEFRKLIAKALDAADVVIVVWSKHSIDSDWVLDEAMHGRDRRTLVPVTIDGSQSPLGFRQYQVINLTAWGGDRSASEWADLSKAVRTAASGAARNAVSSSPVSPAAARVTPTPISQERRRLLLGASGTALAAALGGGYFAWKRRSIGDAAANSLAVLPFRNLSEDASQNFFSDGLAEEIRIALSRDSQLRVAAQTSSNVFRDRKETAQAIAGALHVAFLLDGSVRRAAEVLRIGVTLIDAGTGFNRWSRRFDRTLNDVFALQSEIADIVATTISSQMGTPRRTVGGTSSVEAFDAYLRGLELFHQDAGEQSDRAALTAFEAAIAADPNYASAHAARSRALVNFGGQYATADALAGYYAAAESAARRAIAIAPELPDAHLALGEVLFACRLKVRDARESYDDVFRLGAGDANMLNAYAFYCAQTGRAADAQAAIQKAVSLDPINARAYQMQGWVLYAARRFPEAIASLEHALSLNPKLANAHSSIGDASLLMGRVDRARDAYAAEPAEMFRLTGLAIVERRLDHLAAAQAANDRLVSQLGDSALYQQAQVQAQWGQAERAIALLLRARTIADQGLLYSHSDPLIDSLRSDARFQGIEHELGFI